MMNKWDLIGYLFIKEEHEKGFEKQIQAKQRIWYFLVGG